MRKHSDNDNDKVATKSRAWATLSLLKYPLDNWKYHHQFLKRSKIFLRANVQAPITPDRSCKSDNTISES